MSKKVLAEDLNFEDHILLNRPEAKIVKITDLSDVYRQAPKGKIITVEITGGAFKGEQDTIVLLNEDKVDRTKTKTWWQKLWSRGETKKIKLDKPTSTTDYAAIPSFARPNK